MLAGYGEAELSDAVSSCDAGRIDAGFSKRPVCVNSGVEDPDVLSQVALEIAGGCGDDPSTVAIADCVGIAVAPDAQLSQQDE